MENQRVLEQILFYLKMEYFELAIRRFEKIYPTALNKQSLTSSYALALLSSGRAEQCLELLSNALNNKSIDATSLQLYVMLLNRDGLYEKARDCLETYMSFVSGPKMQEALMHRIALDLANSRKSGAEKGFEQLLESPGSAIKDQACWLFNGLFDFKSNLNIASWPKVTETFYDGGIKYVPGKSERLVIILPNSRLSQGIDNIRRWYSELSILDAGKLFIFDYKLLSCLSGLWGMQGDFDEQATNLKHLIASLGYREVVMIAVSGAGLSAAVLGCKIKAKGLLSFGGLTHVNESWVEPKYKSLVRIMSQKISDGFPEDLTSYLRNFDFIIHQHYASRSLTDTKCADLLSGLKNCQKYPYPINHHPVINWLKANQLLTPVFTNFYNAIGWRNS